MCTNGCSSPGTERVGGACAPAVPGSATMRPLLNRLQRIAPVVYARLIPDATAFWCVSPHPNMPDELPHLRILPKG